MINLKNLDKWHHLVGGEMMSFANPNPRMVRVDINAPFETRLYATFDSAPDEARFIAVVQGMDVVQFGVEGAFTLYGDGDFSMYSSEVETVAFEVLDPVIFTEIAERRARNPELEYMMRRMQENMERRLAATTDEFRQQLEEARHVNPPAPAPVVAQPKPTAAPVVAVPGPDAGGDGGAAPSKPTVVAAQ